MWYNEQYWTYRPNTKKWTDFMKKNLKEQKIKSKTCEAEIRFMKKLEPLKNKYQIHFRRQKQRWTRIFDFRCKQYWIAVEVDWWYHQTKWKKEKDERYDRYNKEHSWIEIVRVNNFDEEWAERAINQIIDISRIGSWWARKRIQFKDDKRYRKRFKLIDIENQSKKSKG